MKQLQQEEVPTKRTWLKVALAGFAIAFYGLIVTAVVTTHVDVGWIAWAVLPGFATGVLVGGVIMLIGSVLAPERRTWRGITLIVWAAIAVASPLAGILYLVPWIVLAVTSPLLIWVFLALLR